MTREKVRSPETCWPPTDRDRPVAESDIVPAAESSATLSAPLPVTPGRASATVPLTVPAYDPPAMVRLPEPWVTAMPGTPSEALLTATVSTEVPWASTVRLSARSPVRVKAPRVSAKPVSRSATWPVAVSRSTATARPLLIGKPAGAVTS